jgi:hypothetical protein
MCVCVYIYIYIYIYIPPLERHQTISNTLLARRICIQLHRNPSVVRKKKKVHLTHNVCFILSKIYFSLILFTLTNIERYTLKTLEARRFDLRGKRPLKKKKVRFEPKMKYVDKSQCMLNTNRHDNPYSKPSGYTGYTQKNGAVSKS